MAMEQNAMTNGVASFESLLVTIASLSDQAEARGDQVSANILLNVAALLAEVQDMRSPVAHSGHVSTPALIAA